MLNVTNQLLFVCSISSRPVCYLLVGSFANGVNSLVEFFNMFSCFNSRVDGGLFCQVMAKYIEEGASVSDALSAMPADWKH